MKKVITSIILIASSFIALGQNVNFKGTIHKPTGDAVYVNRISIENNRYKREVIDSAKLDNGQFEMNFKLDSAELLQFSDGNEIASLIFHPGDDLYLTLHTDFFDETIQYDGKGSEKNNIIARFSIVNEVVYNDLYERLDDLSTNDEDKILSIIDSSFNILEDCLKDLVSGNKDAELFFKSKSDELEQARKGFKRQVDNELEFLKLEKELLGKDLIDFIGVDLDGNETKISKFKGKPMVIDFWATWCGPCKQQIPFLKEVEEKYKDEITIVSVGVWCKEDDWNKMAQDFELTHNIFLEKGKEEEIATKYKIQYIPRYFLVDENLKIVNIRASMPSTGDLDKEINTLLSK